jgi:hypothetical protein
MFDQGETLYPPLPGRATVLINIRFIDEILLAEAPFGSTRGGQRLRNDHAIPASLACQKLFALEVTSVGDRGKFFAARYATRLLGHRAQLTAVDPTLVTSCATIKWCFA